jgi:predicted amidohydrolase
MAIFGVVQFDSARGDRQANIARLDGFVAAAAKQGAQIVIAPEMATTGYFVADMLGDLAEPIPGPTTRALGEIARSHSVYVACGMPERHGATFFNSAVLLAPDGMLVGSYRKVHLWADDNRCFTPGRDMGIFDTDLGRVALTICYDLMFPEYIRALVLNGARIVLNCTDWVTPEPHIDALGWSGRVTSGIASSRAIENRVVVAMADRVGVEGAFTSLGYSCICTQLGAFAALLEHGQGVAIASVDVSAHGADERMAEREQKLAEYRRWEAAAEDASSVSVRQGG